MISYAQNLEDVILNRLFQGKKSGFYIDVGACDPVEMSVTKYFYDLGWSGINIEPVSGCYKKLQEDRPLDINLNLAVGSRHDFCEFLEVRDFPAFSSMDREIAEAGARHVNSTLQPGRVEVQTLAAICEKHCHGFIDFLKIDAEGMEKDVIEGADWKRFRPTMLVIESTRPCSGYDPSDPLENTAWQEWEPLILEAGYLHVYDDTLNRYYLRKEDEHLKVRFDYPVNPVRDEFVMYAQVKEAEALEKAGKAFAAEKEKQVQERIQIADTCRFLEGNLKEIEKKGSSLKKKLERRDEMIRGLKQQLKELKKAGTSLEGTLAAVREKIESGHLDNLRLVAEKDFLKEELAERDRKINELNRKGSDLKIDAEKIRDQLEKLRDELDETSSEKEVLHSRVKEMETRISSQETDLDQIRKARNRLSGELKQLRPVAAKIKEQESNMALLRQVLREKQFREDHRIRCFLERFIPFIRWPASTEGTSSFSQPVSKTVSEIGKEKRDEAITRKGGEEPSVKSPVPEKQARSAVEPSVKVMESGLALAEFDDFSFFGMTARHWQAAMKELEKDRNEKGVFFTPSVSATIFRDDVNSQPINRPWIGIVQEPHTIPEWLSKLSGCGGAPWLFEQQAWKESLSHCQGLFALSEYSAEFLQKKFPGKSISVLAHPADLEGAQWSPDKFLGNKYRKVIQPGWYLRNMHSIYEMPETKIERLAVPFHPDRETFQQLFEAEHLERKSRGLLFECMMKTATSREDVSEAELGRMLTENIAFVNLYESNAVDAVVECLARATPLLINPMPAVVEYLGPEYPYYMWCYDQAAEKADDEELILKTHEYLKNLDFRKRMEPRVFRENLMNSEVYKAGAGKAGS